MSFTCSSRERPRTVSRRSSPRSARRRTTAEPTNPFPPVTSVLPTRGSPGLRRRGTQPALAQAGLVEALILHAADALGDRVETLPRDLLSAVHADPVAALVEGLPRLPDAVLLLLQDHQGRLVELLLEGLGALVGRVLVVIGQLVGETVPVPMELLAPALDLLLARVEPLRD